jgi:hypothetical protein
LLCPECGTVVAVPVNLSGRPLFCSGCGHRVAGGAFRRLPGAGQYDDEKPGKVTAIAVMVLVGGIISVLGALVGISLTMGLMILWPFTWVALAGGVWSVVVGAIALGARPGRPLRVQAATITTLIGAGGNLNLITLPLCIVVLVFLADQEVVRWCRPRGAEVVDEDDCD